VFLLQSRIKEEENSFILRNAKMNKILVFVVLFQISGFGQISERFDSISMIKEQNWIEDIRRRIILNFSATDDYSVIIVHTASGDYKNITVYGLRQIRDGDNDPFSQKKPDRFSFEVFSDGAKKSELEEKAISREQFAESTRLFSQTVKSAKLNAMPSKSSSDTEFYIFAKIMDTNNEMAIGQFNSCVLVEPETSHAALLEIDKLIKYTESPENRKLPEK